MIDEMLHTNIQMLFLKILVEYSWFTSVDLSWRDYEYLSFLYLEAPSDGLLVIGFLNERISKCYSENFDYLWRKAVEQFPNRGFAIEPAARAHSCGDYALSIPVFLSQAEGMIRDLTQAELFSKTNKKLRMSQMLLVSSTLRLRSWKAGSIMQMPHFGRR